jgi:hypothetical protein
MTGEPETITTVQVSERYGVKEATVRLWYRKRVIRGYKLPNTRLILIDVKSLREFLQAHANTRN